MIWEKRTRSKTLKVSGWKSLSAVVTTAACCVLGMHSQAAAHSASAQKAFATPDAAAAALIQAAGTYDVPALDEMLGPDGKDLVSSADSVGDKNRSLAFAASAKEKQSVTLDPKSSSRATLSVGNDDWPFPIPIVKRSGKWYFDTKAGQQEILFRRIGQNELDAILVCRGFVEAQKEYASEKHDGSELNEYAQKIISTPGKHDGLAWQNADGTWEGPVGESVAKALAEGYAPDKPPFHGYYFKVLKGQGPAAPLGQMNFVVEGAMIGGFALAAAPAQYRVSGVQTFIVSYEGVVYQKDLGPDTPKIFESMELYNPDKTWQVVDAEQ
ncbi:MAG TPA: DUF2950 domain-containing protein [Bryobacteraceae bacterium]|nr:DUF2950 domain-containing protein [Bryobacteraceae bacterium]